MTWERRIIIGGLPRAGSTLFRLVLDNSLDIIAPPETGFFLKPFDFRHRRLTHSVQRLDRALDLGQTSLSDCLESSSSSLEAFDKLMTLFRTKHHISKKSWAEKSPRNCLHYDRIAQMNAELIFISTIRDGRGVVTSRLGDNQEYHCSIDLYAESIRSIYSFQHERHFIIRYEDMVTSPLDTFRDLFGKINLPFDESYVLNYANSAPTRNLSDHKQEMLGKKIDRSRIEGWKKAEHQSRIAEFMDNSDAVDCLKLSGYEV